jgi:hypothetical protein
MVGSVSPDLLREIRVLFFVLQEDAWLTNMDLKARRRRDGGW